MSYKTAILVSHVLWCDQPKKWLWSYLNKFDLAKKGCMIKVTLLIGLKTYVLVDLFC